ncbi:MAG: hypothetical protein PHS86_04815 [Syntrophaceae bacterium]|nr:hypothetical protein [Syntrophaceae bacterium]
MDSAELALGKDSKMRVNCITCGHSLNLDEAYDDFEGLVRCYVCSGLFELKTAQGKIKSVRFAQPPQTKPPVAPRENSDSKTIQN